MKRKLARLWRFLIWGPLHTKIESIDVGVISEESVRTQDGTVVGYYAYGSWDPSLPIQDFNFVTFYKIGPFHIGG